MTTILKWAGNKTAIMPELIKHLPAGSRLVEPFAGSCAVMMATDYPHYLVADINPDLINLYLMIQKDHEDVIQIAKELFKDFNSDVQYYRVRQHFNYSISNEVEKAAYFLYLNRHGYRGLCRYNQKGEYNNPYGHYKKPYFPENEIRAFAEKAQRATFICASYDETLALLKTGDVVYCDPPYDGTFTGYHTAGFTEDDQYHLASILERRSSEGHPVIVSNSDTSLTRSLYRNFSRYRLTAIRTGTVTEVDREKWLCRVKVGELETNWINWLTLRAGGVRTWWCPSPDEQVVVLSMGGNLETAFVLPAIYSNQFPPPSDSVDGCVTEYPDGGWFEYEPATGRWHVRGIKSMVIEAVDNITLKTGEFVVDADTTRINSEVVINGGVTQGGGAMSSNGIVVDDHEHTGVLKGGANTGGPV